jgi:hypothetical protein
MQDDFVHVVVAVTAVVNVAVIAVVCDVAVAVAAVVDVIVAVLAETDALHAAVVQIGFAAFQVWVVSPFDKCACPYFD